MLTPSAVRCARSISISRSPRCSASRTHNRRGGGAVDAGRVGRRRGCAPPRTPGALRRRAALQRRGRARRVACRPGGRVRHGDGVREQGDRRPVGSVVSGDTSTIQEVRRWRKRLGGGMRQAGVIAAAGLYALEHNLRRLAEDHDNARVIAAGVEGIPGATLRKPAVPPTSSCSTPSLLRTSSSPVCVRRTCW